MAIKRTTRQRRSRSSISRRKAKYTPFGDVGAKLGGIFGAPGFGRAAGSAIGSIFGSGDYVMNTQPIMTNSLITSSTEVPAFTGPQSTIIRHREYIKDITTSSTAGAFKIEQFQINPGLYESFPWLSNISQCFDEYRLRGMVFQYKTTSSDALNSTNTALGTVIMATEYNAANTTSFTNKQSMESSEWAQSAKPSVSQIHAIECNPAYNAGDGHLFIRHGDPPTGQDLRWYDQGIFNIATTGFQGTNVTIGELWVSYEVELFKSKLPDSLPGLTYSAHLRGSNTGSWNSAPLGLIKVLQNATMPDFTYSSTDFSFYSPPGALYEITIRWVCTTGALTAVTVPGVFGASIVTRGNSTVYSNLAGVSGEAIYHFFIQSNTTIPGTVRVELSAISSTLSGGFVDIYINNVDSSITA